MAQRQQSGTAALKQAQALFAQRDFAQCVTFINDALAANVFDPQTIAAARDLRFRADGQAQLQEMVVDALRIVADAWKRADSAKMLAELARIPMDYPEPEIRERRDVLARDLERLRVARGRLAASRSLLQHNEIEAAHREMTKARHCEPLPDSVRTELGDLSANLEQRLEQQRREELEAVHTALAEAHAALESADIAGCLRSLDDRALSRSGIPETTRADMRALRERAKRAAALDQRLKSAKDLLDVGRFDDALTALKSESTDDLPRCFDEKCIMLREAIHQARREYVEAFRDEMRGKLDDVDKALEHETDSDFGAILASVEKSPHADAAIVERARALAEDIDQRPRLRELLREARNALEKRLGDVELYLDQLPENLRTWAASQRVEILDRLASRREELREALEARVTHVLNEVPELLEEGDVNDARRKLHSVLSDVTAGSSLAKRHAELHARLAVVEQWQTRLQRLVTAIDEGEFQAVRVKCDEYAGIADVPAFAARGLAQCSEESVRRIDARRATISKQLSLLQAQVELRGRRIRNLDERLNHLVSDRYATAEHRRTADAIRKTFRSLPDLSPVGRGSSGRATALVGVAIVASSLAFLVPAILWKRNQIARDTPQLVNENSAALARSDPQQDVPDSSATNQPSPQSLSVEDAPPSAGPSVAGYLEQVRMRLSSRLFDVTPPSVASPPSLRFSPANELPTTLVADVEVGAPIELARVSTDDELHALEFDSRWEQQLFGELAVDNSPTTETETTTPQPVSERSAAFALDELRRQLPNLSFSEVEAEDGKKINALMGRQSLIPFVTRDANGEGFGDVAAAVRWFSDQAYLVETLRNDAMRAVVDSRFDGVLQLIDKEFELLEFDGNAAVVSARARLPVDERPGTAFSLTGTISARETSIRADEKSREAFARYVDELRAYRADQTPALLAQALNVPSLIDVTIADGYAGGESLPIALRYRDADLVQLRADWNPESFAFGVDLDSAREAFAAGVSKLVSSANESEFAALRSACLPALREYADSGESRLFDVNGYSLASLTFAESTKEKPLRVPATIMLIGSNESGPAIPIHGVALFTEQGFVWDDFQVAPQTVAMLRSQASAAIPAAEATPPVADETEQNQDDENAVAAASDRVDDQLLRDDATDARVESSDATENSSEPTETANANDVPAAVAPEAKAPGQDDADPQVARIVALSREKIATTDSSLQLPENWERDGARLSALVAASREWDAFLTADPAQVRPDIFCEYFLTDDGMKGVSWRVLRDDDGEISDISALNEWEVFSNDSLAQISDVDAYRIAYRDARIGEALLGPLFDDDAIRADGRGNLGIVIAPVGVTWMTRWEQVRFATRDAAGFADANAAGDVADFSQLLFSSGRKTTNVAIWCVPSILGRLGDDVAGAEISAGQIGMQQRYLLRFRKYPNAVFAPVMSPSAANDPDWGSDVRDMTLQNIGTRFWQRGWTASGWRETPFVGFCVAMQDVTNN